MSRIRIELGATTVLVLVVFSFAITGGSWPFPNIPSGRAATRTIVLVGSVPGWNSTSPPANPAITVAQGDSVTAVLSSGDGIVHRFFVDVNGNGVPDCAGPDKCSSVFTSMTTATFAVVFAPGAYTYYCSIHPASMHGTFTVQAAGTPDFSLSASPMNIGLLKTDAQGTSMIEVTPIGGFNGQVTLTVSTSAGLTASASPTSIVGGSGSSQLTLSSMTTGIYTATVTGTSNRLSHSVMVSVNFGSGDFSISLSPMSLNVADGSSGTFNVLLQSLNGFSGSIALTTSSDSGGPSLSANPEMVTLMQDGTGTSQVTVTFFASTGLYGYGTSTPAGTYIITVTGSSGPITHTASVTTIVGGQSSSPSSGANGGMSIGISSLLAGALAVSVVIVAGSTAIFLTRRSKHGK